MDRLTEQLANNSYKLNTQELLITKCGKMEDFIEYIVDKADNNAPDSRYNWAKDLLKDYELI